MNKKHIDEYDIMSSDALILAISKKRSWLITFGILLIIAGIAAIIFPLISSISVILIIGFILVVSGVVQFAQAFGYHKWDDLILAFFASIVWVVAGMLLLTRPAESVAVLTLFLAVAFIAEGILKSILAFKMNAFKGWGWFLFDGGMAIILGALLWIQFPFSAMWAIGVLTGINILSSGIATLVIAFALKDVRRIQK